MDLEAFSDGLRDWLRGEDSEAGDAAGINLAEILLQHRAYVTRKRE